MKPELKTIDLLPGDEAMTSFTPTLGSRVRYLNAKDEWKAGQVIGHDPYSPALQVKEDGGQWWYIDPERLYPDDGSELPVFAPKGCEHIGWIQEIIWTDGTSRTYFDGADKKPASWKTWKHADLTAPTVVAERIRPVFSPV